MQNHNEKLWDCRNCGNPMLFFMLHYVVYRNKFTLFYLINKKHRKVLFGGGYRAVRAEPQLWGTETSLYLLPQYLAARPSGLATSYRKDACRIDVDKLADNIMFIF